MHAGSGSLDTLLSFTTSCRGGVGILACKCTGLEAGVGLYRFKANYTKLVHTGGMGATSRNVRQSVSLPEKMAAQVRSLAKTRRVSANRMLVELIENGIDSEKRKQREFFELAERFRRATDPKEVKRLGDQLGRMVFSG
jgi:hypothetical protein